MAAPRGSVRRRLRAGALVVGCVVATVLVLLFVRHNSDGGHTPFVAATVAPEPHVCDVSPPGPSIDGELAFLDLSVAGPDQRQLHVAVSEVTRQTSYVLHVERLEGSRTTFATTTQLGRLAPGDSVDRVVDLPVFPAGRVGLMAELCAPGQVPASMYDIAMPRNGSVLLAGTGYELRELVLKSDLDAGVISKQEYEHGSLCLHLADPASEPGCVHH